MFFIAVLGLTCNLGLVLRTCGCCLVRRLGVLASTWSSSRSTLGAWIFGVVGLAACGRWLSSFAVVLLITTRIPSCNLGLVLCTCGYRRHVRLDDGCLGDASSRRRFQTLAMLGRCRSTVAASNRVECGVAIGLQPDRLQHASIHHGVPAGAASDSCVFDNVVCRLLADPVIAIAAIPGACQTLGDYLDNRRVRRFAFVTSRSNCPLLLA